MFDNLADLSLEKVLKNRKVIVVGILIVCLFIGFSVTRCTELHFSGEATEEELEQGSEPLESDPESEEIVRAKEGLTEEDRERIAAYGRDTLAVIDLLVMDWQPLSRHYYQKASIHYS